MICLKASRRKPRISRPPAHISNFQPSNPRIENPQASHNVLSSLVAAFHAGLLTPRLHSNRFIILALPSNCLTPTPRCLVHQAAVVLCNGMKGSGSACQLKDSGRYALCMRRFHKSRNLPHEPGKPIWTIPEPKTMHLTCINIFIQDPGKQSPRTSPGFSYFERIQSTVMLENSSKKTRMTQQLSLEMRALRLVTARETPHWRPTIRAETGMKTHTVPANPLYIGYYGTV